MKRPAGTGGRIAAGSPTSMTARDGAELGGGGEEEQGGCDGRGRGQAETRGRPYSRMYCSSCKRKGSAPTARRSVARRGVTS